MARSGHFDTPQPLGRADGNVPIIDTSASRVTVLPTGVVSELGVPTIEMTFRLGLFANWSCARTVIAKS
jgi:hypothetical protein